MIYPGNPVNNSNELIHLRLNEMKDISFAELKTYYRV